MFWKRIQIGMIHAAVAITLVPINGTLNRIMIKELALSATLVAVLVSLAYLFSPIQVAIGAFSDRHPVFGWRRTPYIILGWLLCIGGLILSPHIAFLLAADPMRGFLLGIPVFGAWGLGYNFATVSYFSLATELSGEDGRSRTISVMFFIMIVSIILTSISLSRLLDPYSPEVLISSFRTVAGIAFIAGAIGLLGLEPRGSVRSDAQEEKYNWGEMFKVITKNREATRFFWYLLFLLTAIFAQDILLEPYGAEAFGLAPSATTRITAIWGIAFLITLILGGALESRVPKLKQARIGAWGGIVAIGLVIVSGLVANIPMFYAGVVFLGLATGLSTVSNLSLMFDMTVVGSVGLFMGAWGMASAVSRLSGNLISGVVRDVVTQVTQDTVLGYIMAFGLEIGMFLVSLAILSKVDVSVFQKESEQKLSVVERAALGNEA